MGKDKEKIPKEYLETKGIISIGLKALFAVLGIGALVFSVVTGHTVWAILTGVCCLGYAIFMALDAM